MNFFENYMSPKIFFWTNRMQFSLLRPKFNSTKLKSFHSNSETNYKPAKNFYKSLFLKMFPWTPKMQLQFLQPCRKNFARTSTFFHSKSQIFYENMSLPFMFLKNDHLDNWKAVLTNLPKYSGREADICPFTVRQKTGF